MKFLNMNDISDLKKDRIFKIATLAINAKNEGHYVYNATLGTLYDETLNLLIHKSIYETFNQIDDRKKAAYAPAVDGGCAFAEAVKKWVFQKNEFLKTAQVVATPGGSGALSTIFSKTVKPNQHIIIPDIFWGPYELMMETRNIQPKKCNCFENDRFSLDAIKQAMIEVSKIQDNIVVVMNDPAHNPTGYSMGLEKWKEFIAFCNGIAQNGKTVTIVNDIAYIDYSYDFDTSRDYMEAFKDISDQVMVIFAFSGSKTLTAYGFRIGAALIYANNKDEVTTVHDVFEHNARATWSNVNNGALHLLITLLQDDFAFKNDLKQAVTMLKERRKRFIEKADEVGLKYYPTSEGFFVTLKGINDNELLFQKLMKKHIYVVPLPKGIRIAICALPLEQCERLPKLIQEAIEEIKNAN